MDSSGDSLNCFYPISTCTLNGMRILIFSLTFLLTYPLAAQPDSVQSGLYRWEKHGAEAESGERREFLEGTTRDLEFLEVEALTLPASQPTHSKHMNDDLEELLIVKEGKLKVTLQDHQTILGPGSVVLIMPGDEYALENSGDGEASYYSMRYRSKSGMDAIRGEENGGSLILDWNDIPFKAHDKGGVRHYFERPTTMLNRFEMHVTTLNAGLKSHDPHTHRAAEIILMIEGSTKEQIDGQFYEGSTGDLYFLGSETLHAIENTGTEPCMYFAFQFD